MTNTHNRNRSPDDLEREVESARAELTRSIERLEEEFSPDALVERGMAYFRGDGRRHFETLGSKAQANPLSVVLIGIGIAWLAFGPSRGADRGLRDRRDDGDYPDPRDDLAMDPYAAPPASRAGASLSQNALSGRTGTAEAETIRSELSGDRPATSATASATDPLGSPDRPLTKDTSRAAESGTPPGERVATGTGVGISPVRDPAVSVDDDGADSGKIR